VPYLHLYNSMRTTGTITKSSHNMPRVTAILVSTCESVTGLRSMSLERTPQQARAAALNPSDEAPQTSTAKHWRAAHHKALHYFSGTNRNCCGPKQSRRILNCGSMTLDHGAGQGVI
jgi:hypothetical protein